MTRNERALNPQGESDKPAGEPHDFTISAEDAGARLDKWLSERLEGLTRTRLKALIEGGALARGGEPFADPSWKLRTGETYRLTVPPVADAAPKPEAIPLDVVYEDADLIIVNKLRQLIGGLATKDEITAESVEPAVRKMKYLILD